MNRSVRIALVSASAAAVAVAAWSATATGQGAKGPKARYVMNVTTTTGMAGMTGGGMGSAMSMMFGGRGGNNESHQVLLKLGSSLAPTGGPAAADHFPPAGARMGRALPLTHVVGKGVEHPTEFQRPKGRLLVFWGCGAKAGPGQPVIIDFAKVAAGQMPPNLFSTRVPVDNGPSPSNSRTYGDWPSSKGGKQPERGASLIGEHRVAGNYSPEIKFNLAQDFMPGITGRSSPGAGGSTNISWNSVAQATGYYAWAFGTKGGGNDGADMVWWSSSTTREFGGGLWDWLSPETVRRLITDKVVMPPSQTSCVIPAEVKAASGDFLMGTLYAYGPEANFAYPPRPADPKIAWNPEWTTRVRYRSNTMWMIGGPDMGGMGMMGGDEDEDDGDRQARPRPQPKKKCKGGIGGLLSGAITGQGC